jgi:Na+:H+ antiporter
MDVGRILVDLLVVLLASRLAAEATERIRQPAVLGEILVGMAIGPSALGLVKDGEILGVLGEIGVILLLFEVGRQMDLRELSRVGGASLRVAFIGVGVPMAIGYLVMRAVGVHATEAIFLAGGITATSVGITARVFGDLRALASPEARTVLGAAVADDILGLLVLTVVVRTAGGQGLSAMDVTGTAGLAIGFVVVATIVGSWLAPRVLDRLAPRVRTEGTIMVLGLAVALGFARIASAARLAPIVGAFVAGLAVGRSAGADDLHRRLTPLGHFFIPIFFLGIGIKADLGVFTDASMLGIAGALAVVAVAGKIVAGLGAGRGSADRLLVGIAMIPRGEVGLIFASIGLTGGILDQRLYGVLVAVVMATTLVSPAWIRHRIERTRRRATSGRTTVEPAGGWLVIGPDEVELAAEPSPALAPRIALDAAASCAERRPGAELCRWLAARNEPVEWDDNLRAALLSLIRDGNARSWRFLEVTGQLPVLLPDLAGALARGARDPFELDPGRLPILDLLDDLKQAVARDEQAIRAWADVADRDTVLLATFARGILASTKDPGAPAAQFAARIGLGAEAAETLSFLVAEAPLLFAAASRPDSATEENILELAGHIGSRERAAGLYLLAVALDAMEPWQREQLDELSRLIVEALAHPDLTGTSARDIVNERLEAVGRILARVPSKELRQHLWAAPRRYLLTQSAPAIARHIRMIEVKPGRDEVRLLADPGSTYEEWTVHLAAQDRRGLLATIAGTFTSARISVLDAQIATWRNGIAVDVFKVLAPVGVDWDAVRRSIEAALAAGVMPEPAVIEGVVSIDNTASPWHTIVEIRGADRVGLLHRVAAALAGARLQIHQATVTTRDGTAVDTFWVTGPNGGKLDAGGEEMLRAAFAGRPQKRRLAPWRRERAAAGA